MHTLYAGTSGWSYSSWKPGFYPAKLPSKKFLEHYASRLNSVEVNYTFRALPSEAMLSGWLTSTPPAFRFSFKAPQRITHILRLRNCAEPFSRFVDSLRPAIEQNRMGLALFQFPPNFRVEKRPALEQFLSDIAATVARHRLNCAVEFRDASWFQDETWTLLRDYQVSLCAAESDDLLCPQIRTAPFACYRLRRSNYSPEEIAVIKNRLLAQLDQGDVYAYFKHEDEPTGAFHAEAVLTP